MSSLAPPDEVRAMIERAYDAFNRRDIDAVLATMAPDVQWPTAWEGGEVSGHQAVRDYWARHWRELDALDVSAPFHPVSGWKRAQSDQSPQSATVNGAVHGGPAA